MATLTIRGVDDDTKRRLRVRAARNGRSMEAEARAILDETLVEPESGLGTRIHQRFATIGSGLEPAKRIEAPRAASLRR